MKILMNYDIISSQRPQFVLISNLHFTKRKNLSTHHCIHVSVYLNYSSTTAGIVRKLYMYMKIVIWSEINC